MKSILKLTVLLAVVLIVFNSCSKTNDEVKMIPSNALIVLHFDTKSLMTKLSWDEIKQTSWFKELYNDTAIKAWTKKLMDNPAASGIDLDKSLVFILQKTITDNGQLIFEGEVKDAAAFEAFNKNLDANATTAKDGDISTLTLNDKTAVGWTNKKFVYVIGAPALPSGMNSNTSTTTNIVQVCKKLFVLKTDSSMAKNERFSSLLKEPGDVHVWQNTEAMVNSSTPMGPLSMLKLDALLKGNISTATGSFENGKITVKQKFYASPELTDLLKKYGGGKVNTDMLKNIPSQNIDGFVALHFKPEGLREIIKLTGFDGIINSALSQQGITIDDFVKANKGDLVFAVTDFMMKKDSFNFRNQSLADTNYSYNKPSVSYLFSVAIGDKPSFNKLMAAGQKLGGDITGNLGVYFASNDKLFVISNSQQYASKYLAGSDNKFDFINSIGDHPIAFFVDIQKLLVSSSGNLSATDTSGKIIFDESLKIWQNAHSLGGEYNDDAFVMTSEINLVDKNVNSLKQLNTYFDRISNVLIEKKKKLQQAWPGDDSSSVYPPMSNIDTTMPANH